MKALNRKSSITSLPQQNSIGGDSFDTNTTRGSMPPESIGSSTPAGKPISSARAKSMSKEPDSSGPTMPSRFFSLSRRLGAKIRFSSSSQPPSKQASTNGLSAKSATNLASEDLKESSVLKKSSVKMTQSQLLVPSISVEDVQQPKAAESATVVSNGSVADEKKNLRERALSPSRIFRSLRPRSPFGRSNKASKVHFTT